MLSRDAVLEVQDRLAAQSLKARTALETRHMYM